MGMANMGKMMKQVQQMQEKMQKMQAEIEQRTIEVTAGGGAVKVVANGKQQIVSIEISPDVVDPGDVEMLQDIILAAVNEAIQKTQEMMQEEMKKITGGLSIPGLF